MSEWSDCVDDDDEKSSTAFLTLVLVLTTLDGVFSSLKAEEEVSFRLLLLQLSSFLAS